jgi:hypothetical protein
MGCTTLVLIFVKRIQAPYGEAWLHEIKHDGFPGHRPQGRRTGAALQPPRAITSPTASR